VGRPRKKADELVPAEAPLQEIAEAEEQTTGEPVARARRGRRKAEPASARQPAPSAPSSGAEAAVRAPMPERARGRRKERRGVVVSNAMDKTIVVRVDTVRPDPRYKKVVRRSRKFHAHDEQNRANVGDVVRIVESRPLSKLKAWRLAEVVEQAR
jgi:small subunit ribosomal protein S17